MDNIFLRFKSLSEIKNHDMLPLYCEHRRKFCPFHIYYIELLIKVRKISIHNYACNYFQTLPSTTFFTLTTNNKTIFSLTLNNACNDYHQSFYELKKLNIKWWSKETVSFYWNAEIEKYLLRGNMMEVQSCFRKDSCVHYEF